MRSAFTPHPLPLPSSYHNGSVLLPLIPCPAPCRHTLQVQNLCWFLLPNQSHCNINNLKKCYFLSPDHRDFYTSTFHSSSSLLHGKSAVNEGRSGHQLPLLSWLDHVGTIKQSCPSVFRFTITTRKAEVMLLPLHPGALASLSAVTDCFHGNFLLLFWRPNLPCASLSIAFLRGKTALTLSWKWSKRAKFS